MGEPFDENEEDEKVVQEGGESSPRHDGTESYADEEIDDMLVDEILQLMWAQRRYQARGGQLSLKKGARNPSRNDGTLSRRPSRIITEGITEHRNSRRSGFEEYGMTASCPASAYSGRASRQSSSVDEEDEAADRTRRRSLTFGPR